MEPGHAQAWLHFSHRGHVMIREIFGVLAEGVVNSFANAAFLSSDAIANGHEPGRIERLCRQIGEPGWQIDEQSGRASQLYFNDALLGIRKVTVIGGDEPMVLFAVRSHAVIPEDRLPSQVLSYLLRRNMELSLPAWQMYVSDDGQATFGLYYHAFGPGLTPEFFKHLCSTMAAEASAFDHKLRQAGLLRLP
jgi:hypothetical protein